MVNVSLSAATMVFFYVFYCFGQGRSVDPEAFLIAAALAIGISSAIATIADWISTRSADSG